MKPIDKTAKMCIIAASKQASKQASKRSGTDRVTIPFSPHAYITKYTKRNDKAGAVCPAGSLRFFA